MHDRGRTAEGDANPVALALTRALQSWDGLLERLPVGVYSCDRDGVLVQYNARAAELWGRSPPLDDPAVRYGGALRAYHPDGEILAQIDAPMVEALRTAAPVRDREVIVERPDGSRIHILINIDPLFDEDGALLGAVNCFQDITAMKAAEARQKRLADELNHRVKNTLASVQSIARHTARQADTLAGFNPMFESRLMALSRAHDLLTGSCWTGARLSDVLVQSLAPYGVGGRAQISGDDVELDPRMALALSMALHELADNAARHGALSDPAGRLDIAARHANGDAGVILDWVETGGPAVRAPTKQGFGLRLIETIVASDLDGAVDVSFPAEGARCAIAFPLPAAVVIQ